MEALFSLLQRPVLWERSAAPFWDDEHISKSMLSAHLDPNTDAASRRPEIIASSAEFLSSFFPETAGFWIWAAVRGCIPGCGRKRDML